MMTPIDGILLGVFLLALGATMAAFLTSRHLSLWQLWVTTITAALLCCAGVISLFVGLVLFIALV